MRRLLQEFGRIFESYTVEEDVNGNVHIVGKRRLSSIERLPHDILDRILALSVDFLTLQSVVLSCPKFYDVYCARRDSIRHEVMIRDYGPHIRALNYAEMTPTSRPRNVQCKTPELYFNGSISLEEEKNLRRYRSTARAFANYCPTL